MNKLATWALCALLLPGVAGAAAAQTFQGGVRGIVKDRDGVLPGAEVQIINENTNAVRSTTTTGNGEYVFSSVVPGTYTLKVLLTGFKTAENREIRVGTQQFLTIDFTLEVGGVQEAITVTGQAPIIETSTASVSSSLDKTTLEMLPTAGRNAFFLSVTTPNVIPSGDPQFVRQQDQTNSSLLSLAGGPRRGNNYTLDGVPITDMRNRAVAIPNIEGIDEVKVQVSTYDAEMGRTGGGVFNTLHRSGANAFQGSAMFQNRPKWGSGRFYFDEKAGRPKPDTYFYLGGGSAGGPILRNRTFFWFATENYQTKTPRNTVLTLPTELERRGDFSQSGVTIYDPLRTTIDPVTGQPVRQPFEGNRIPENRISPVARSILQHIPLPTTGKSRPSTAELIDKAIQFSGKVDHRFSDKWSTSGTYLFYDSEEPESRFYALKLGENPADPSEGLLLRTVHIAAMNNTWIPSGTTVATFRYGFTQFIDDDVPNEFDPATLGFSQAFLNVMPRKKFPRMNIDGYGRAGNPFTGDRDITDTTYYGHNVNATLSKLLGRHSLKTGFDFRVIGMKLFAQGQSSGEFFFTTGFTQGPNPLNPARGTGDAFASFLLGFPDRGDIPVATPFDFHINYFGGFLQDDWRVTQNLTLNLGIRLEHEEGLRDRADHLAVGFSRDKAWPVQPIPGLNLRGGLLYAGVDGAPTHQSDPRTIKPGPRGGFAWSITPNTVLRSGYGLFWAPYQYAFPTEDRLGTRGFSASTTYFASADGGLTPAGNIVNPFPGSIEQPRGSAGGLTTGAGGTVHFVDQFRKDAYVQQFSVDLQRELPGQISVSAGYVGSRTENLGIGGTDSNQVWINQIDPQSQSLGPALNELVPNPFFGNPLFGPLSRAPLIARGQLLRPYPQFGDIRAHQVSKGKARYHSMVLKFERRLFGGWGARVNYTLSKMEDNIFGERNFFSQNSNTPARAINNYDLDREFARSHMDAPHRLNITGTYELPFGQGKRWLNRGGIANVVLGGWAVTGVGSYQSGFPLVVFQNANNSGLFGSFQRPNLTGQSPRVSGSPQDNFDPSCNCIRWINPAAWTNAPAFTFGNAPRTETRQRTPFRTNWDIAFQKTQMIGAKSVMVRFELINAFANPNWRGPVTAFGRADFGRITEVGGFPRMLQVLIRFGW